MFSGGVASFCAALRAREQYELTLLFTDTNMEDPDLYRFLRESAQAVDAPLVWLRDGRNVWDVFRDSRFIGNSRIDPCSRILKREPARRYIKTHGVETIVLGMDWTEGKRAKESTEAYAPVKVLCPLLDPPYLEKKDMFQVCLDHGIEPPALYARGFSHNNCGGFCVKAGHAHFANLLKQYPERYAYHEAREAEMRELLGDVSVLRDRRGGTTKPLSLAAFRERLGVDPTDFDPADIGGCGCFTEADDGEPKDQT